MDENNKKVDELLHLLGQEISDARFKEMNAEKSVEYEPYNINVNKHSLKWKRVLKVCCLMICMLIGVTAVTTATSEAFRMKVFGFLFEDKGGHVELVQFDEQQILYPTYLPDGYKKISEGEFGSAWEINYQKEGIDDFITISEDFGTSAKMAFDTESTSSEKCMVGEYEAYYFSGKEDGDINVLVWQQDDILIEVTAMLEKEKMIKIGNSLK